MTNEETIYNTPGQLIDDLLKARHWDQQTLAIVLEVSNSSINKIISGSQAVTAEMALALGEIFDVPAERFLELQKSYELARAKIMARPDPDRAQRAKLFGDLPVSEMIKRGWLNVDSIRNVSAVEAELAIFFGTSSPSEIEILPHAARKTDVTGDITPAQLAWLYRVKAIANDMLVSRFSSAAAKDVADKLKPLLASQAAARKVPKVFAEAGIRLVIVESLPRAKIDGVCFWLDDNSPVIGLSLRYDRIDNFWFVLRHELEHVIREHGKTSVILDVELEGERAGCSNNIAEEEKVANQAAAEFCVPKRSLDSFIARKSPLFKENDLIGFANTLHIHPGLVVGQLQHRLNRYEIFRNHLVKIRSSVVPGAMADGWGNVVPVER